MISTKDDVSIRVGRYSRARLMDALELLGFFLIVLLPAFLSNFTPDTSQAAQHSELYSQLGFLKELLSSLQFGLVAAFFLSWRDPRRFWGDLASREIPFPKQMLAGLGLWFAYYLFFDLWGFLGALAGIHSPSIAWLHPANANETALNAVFSAVNGISEEVMRVYLLEQTRRLGLGRNGAAIAAAVAISSYHLYQGAFTIGAFLIVNFVFNRLYLSKKPLVTLITWHILSDFMHSTDLVGWQLVTELVNGSLGMGLFALFKGLRHLF